MVILRVQPGTSISDHFGLHFGAPFPGPFGGPFGDRFLDLPVVLGTPFGVDFRPPFGIQLEPKMDAIWVCYVRPFGPILRVHFGVEFRPPWRLLRPGGPRRPPEPPGLGPPEPSKMLHFGPFWASWGLLAAFGPPEAQNLQKCFIFGHLEPPRASWRPLGLRRPPKASGERFFNLSHLATAVLRYTSPLRHFATAFPKDWGPAAWAPPGLFGDTREQTRPLAGQMSG